MGQKGGFLFVGKVDYLFVMAMHRQKLCDD